MAYPNFTSSLIIIPQTSGSSIGGQYPFIERQISGSNLFIITDANGVLTGSSTIPFAAFTDITASNITASGYISASNIYVDNNLTVQNTGSFTYIISNNISASGTIIASRITASLHGTASWALNALSSSYAFSSSYALSASFAVTSSNARSASWVAGVNVSGSVVSSSYALSSSYAFSSSYALSSSNARSASWVSGANVSGSVLTASYAIDSISSSYVSGAQSVINNLFNHTLTSSTGILAGGLYVTGNSIFAGDLTILGTSSIINISSSNIFIGDNRILLNAYSSGSPFPQRYSGIDVVDTGSTYNVSSSLLWDGQNNYWLLNTNDSGSSSTSSAIILQGPTSSFGNETLLTVNKFLKVQTTKGNMMESQLAEVGTVLQYNGNLSASGYISASNIYVDNRITAPTGSFSSLNISLTGSSPGVGDQVPASPTQFGLPGQLEVDNNFLYVYTNNIWKRIPLCNWVL